MKFFTHLAICSLFCGMLFGMERERTPEQKDAMEQLVRRGTDIMCELLLPQIQENLEEAGPADERLSLFDTNYAQLHENVEKLSVQLQSNTDMEMGQIDEDIQAIEAQFERLLDDPLVRRKSEIHIALVHEKFGTIKTLLTLYKAWLGDRINEQKNSQ